MEHGFMGVDIYSEIFFLESQTDLFTFSPTKLQTAPLFFSSSQS